MQVGRRRSLPRQSWRPWSASSAPPSVTMAIIFRVAIPFLALQALGLALVIIFPELILWLPRIVYG